MTDDRRHQRVSVSVTVNGFEHELDVEPRITLADSLRSDLQLTGTHLGCEQGACGACTVLVDDLPVRSCLMFMFQVDGRNVTTIEGLASENELHELQRSFLQSRALQCGFCTPGLIVGIVGLDRKLTKEEVRDYVGGHICRCTGYDSILKAAEEYLSGRQMLVEEPPDES